MKILETPSISNTFTAFRITIHNIHLQKWCTEIDDLKYPNQIFLIGKLTLHFGVARAKIIWSYRRCPRYPSGQYFRCLHDHRWHYDHDPLVGVQPVQPFCYFHDLHLLLFQKKCIDERVNTIKNTQIRDSKLTHCICWKNVKLAIDNQYQTL